jgi:DNA-binding response OmpR family regulator
MIKELLESNGYLVVTASDGQEALEKCKKEKPDLIILDLMLPKIDGYKVCAMLKFDKNYISIPIIILTARAGESDKELGAEVHADAYVIKPFEPDTLLIKVKEFIK